MNLQHLAHGYDWKLFQSCLYERVFFFDSPAKYTAVDSIGHLSDLVTAISDLLYRFNLEFFCIAFATHNKYLLFTSIVTLSGIYNTRGMPEPFFTAPLNQ